MIGDLQNRLADFEYWNCFASDFEYSLGYLKSASESWIFNIGYNIYNSMWMFIFDLKTRFSHENNVRLVFFRHSLFCHDAFVTTYLPRKSIFFKNDQKYFFSCRFVFFSMKMVYGTNIIPIWAAPYCLRLVSMKNFCGRPCGSFLSSCLLSFFSKNS